MADLDVIPPDFWIRIARLGKRCQFHFARMGDEQRIWRAVIERSAESVVVEDVVLSRAMTAALLKAEAYGWHVEE